MNVTVHFELFTNISEYISVDQNIGAVRNKKTHHSSVGKLTVDDVNIFTHEINRKVI